MSDLTQRETDILSLITEGLSNKEIAMRLQVTPQTVKWYNKQIFKKLDVTNRTQALVKARTLDHRSVDLKEMAVKATPHNLPAAMTSFVGRGQEMQAITRLLHYTRLLTLIGMGGTGKTRLALEVAQTQLDFFPDGVFFIPLTLLQNSSSVLPAVAKCLQVTEVLDRDLWESIINFIGTRQILLVLDNFEHLIDSCGWISELLAATSNLKIIITSREVLRLYGEQVYIVKPMMTPALSQYAPTSLIETNESMLLFIDRIRLLCPNFALNEQALAIIARICIRLEGLPLALEMAAAQIKRMPLEAILAHLNDPLRFLKNELRDKPDHQQTLLQTLDWSYELLDEDEKLLFARLAVFQAGFTVTSVQAVCMQAINVPAEALLYRLADKSLIYTADTLDEQQFYMLDTVQEYALNKLGHLSRL